MPTGPFLTAWGAPRVDRQCKASCRHSHARSSDVARGAPWVRWVLALSWDAQGTQRAVGARVHSPAPAHIASRLNGCAVETTGPSATETLRGSCAVTEPLNARTSGRPQHPNAGTNPSTLSIRIAMRSGTVTCSREWLRLRKDVRPFRGSVCYTNRCTFQQPDRLHKQRYISSAGPVFQSGRDDPFAIPSAPHLKR
jgi:hypothetical protein